MNVLTESIIRLFALFTLLICALPSSGYANTDVHPNLVGFISNVGQWPSEVLFFVRQNGADVWITRTGVVLDEYQTSTESQERTGNVIQEAFSGVNPQLHVSLGTAVSQVSFIKGSDPKNWFSAPVYKTVALVNYYPGVTFTYTCGSDGRVNRSVLVREGADVSKISYEILSGSGHKSLDVSPITSTVYGSYFGGTYSDVLTGLVYLTNGDVVAAGTTTSMEYPGSTGGYSTAIKGTSDGFVVRFDSKLQTVRTYTFIGGSSDDRIRSITRDASNNIYVAGETFANDFPTTSGATGKLYKAGADAFVAKIDSTLTKLIVGFYHGGNKEDIARAISVDKNGLIYVAGSTSSTTNFPVTFPITIRITIPGRRPRDPVTYRDDPGGGANMGQTDGFIASFSPHGSIQQSRFFGREGIEFFTAMAVDASSSVFLTGATTSANFETAPTSDRFTTGRVPYDRTFNGGITDAFVVKLNNELALAKSDDGTYSTFLGGSGEEEGRGIFVDDLGRAHVVGNTTSPNLETIGSLFTQYFGSQDIFLAVLADDGRDLNSATYFGGTGRDEAFGVRQSLSPTNAVIYGTTASNDYPIMGEGATGVRAGATDGFISLINTATNIFSTLISGNATDTIRCVAVNPVGDLYFGAHTTSSDMRTVDSSYRKYAAGRSMYVAKFAFGLLELTAPAGGETWCAGSNKSISWSASGIPDTAKFHIQYSLEGSNVWVDVNKSAAGRTYQWKVPAISNGKYVLRITSGRGHVSELRTPFTISAPPAITTQPRVTSACAGKPATMSVVATGSLLRYQWRKGGVDVAGSTSQSIEITSVDASTVGQYSCVVAGACTPSITSQTVTLAIAQATIITMEPLSQTVEQGKPLTLIVRASGSDLLYQWNKDGAPITGATSSEYTVPSSAIADAGEYKCEVTGGCGKVISAWAQVIVTPSTSVYDQGECESEFIQLRGPSPTSGVVTIRILNAESSRAIARVFDERGLVVGSFTFGPLTSNETDVQISLSNVASGVYSIEVNAGFVFGFVRVIVSR